MSKPVQKITVQATIVVPKPETFYRVVRKSMYAYQLEAVTVDVNQVQVENVGEPDIRTHVMTLLGLKCE